MDVYLTDREAEVMDVLWKAGPSLVAEVREQLPEEFAYTTVLTVLRTLETKGYVDHSTEGRGHRYFAKVEQRVARRSALQHLTQKLFDGSRELLLTHLVSEKRLTADEIKRLRQLAGRVHKGKSQMILNWLVYLVVTCAFIGAAAVWRNAHWVVALPLASSGSPLCSCRSSCRSR